MARQLLGGKRWWFVSPRGVSMGIRKLGRVGRIREYTGGFLLTLPSVVLNGVLVYVAGIGVGLWAAVVVLALWFVIGCAVASATWFHPNRGQAAARSRWAEFAADRMAVDLGYGRDLHGALRKWLPYESSPASTLLAARGRWLGTHPPTTERLQAIRRTAPA
ncbi:M48 family metalloprotease [Nocardia sp. MW-W600-9]